MPAGKADFDGQLVDVIAEGLPIDRAQAIVGTKARGNGVLVRAWMGDVASFGETGLRGDLFLHVCFALQNAKTRRARGFFDYWKLVVFRHLSQVVGCQ